MADTGGSQRTPGEILLGGVDAMYVINLTSRPDRRREIEAQLAGLGLAPDRGKVALFPAVKPDKPGGFPSVGARGCFMSHLGVLEAAQAARFEAIVVAEDDLDFADVCRTAAPSLAEALRTQPWDILYGGYGHVPAGVPVPGHPTLSELASDEPVLCTHFLWFRGRVIGALADYLHRILERPPGHPDGGPMHVDGALTRFRADHPEFRTFAAIPPLGVQRPSRTDIHALRWFDRNPIVREVAQSLRRVRRSIRRA